MPSFDITNKVDMQLMDNALNVARKEIINRFDFRNTKSEIDLNKKDKVINILTEDDMRLKSIIDVIRMRMVKQKLDPKILDEGKEHYASGNMVKKDLKLKEGIDAEAAKKIMKDIKDSKLKVTAQKMDDIIRVSAKKIDDLQRVIGLCQREDYGIPLQFVNMK
jgi:cyclic-di-GMP-binding protein